MPRAGTRSDPVAFDTRILKTDALGGGRGRGLAFRDLAPAGSLLIGFDYSVISRTKVQKIGSLRPIYLLANGSKKLGDPHGEIRHRHALDARPGYAVGAVTVRGDLMLRGFQLTFMRIKGAGLDPADSYESDWIGGKVGNDAQSSRLRAGARRTLWKGRRKHRGTRRFREKGRRLASMPSTSRASPPAG